MNSNPKVRVIRQFRNGNKIWKNGDTFTPNGVFRDHLLRAGFVEIVKPEYVAKAAAAAINPPVKLPTSSKMKAKAKA